jgi:hypothetical protein
MNQVTDFMKQAKGLAKNPLGLIALFVSLIYGFACLVLSTSLNNLNGQDERLPLVWFIIVFPIFILITFIYLVINHHGKLYAPSDFSNEENFVKTLEINAKKFDSVKMEITHQNYKEDHSLTNLVKKQEGKNYNKDLFLPETKKNLEMANSFWEHFQYLLRGNFEKGTLSDLFYGIEAPEYFLLGYSIPAEMLRDRGMAPFSNTIIIRATEDEKGELCLIAIGKDIIEKDSKIFAEKIHAIVEEQLKMLIDPKKIKNR